MLAVEHELQAPANYMHSAGAIGPEHRHFLISWMTMVGAALQQTLFQAPSPADRKYTSPCDS
jgi:hypothetical protein